MERLNSSPETSLQMFPPIVHTGVLLDYLVGHFPIDIPNLEFAKYLDLSVCKPYFVELIEATKDVYIHSDEHRRAFQEKIIDTPLSDDVVAARFQQILKDGAVDYIERKSAAERSRVIYYDPDLYFIGATEPQHGDFTTTNLSTFDVINDGFIPLFEVHTHPTNVLPSPVDYARILINPTQKQFRFLRAAIVLCPSVQILALATNQTVMLDVDTFQKLDQNYKLDDIEQARLISLYDRRFNIIEAMMRYTRESADRFFKASMDLQIRHAQGQITESELSQLLDSESNLTKLELEKKMDKASRVAQHAAFQAATYEAKTVNQKLLEFTRQTNIKLYSATDFEHFTEFSA